MKLIFTIALLASFQSCCINGDGSGFGTALDAVDGFVVDGNGDPIKSVMVVGPAPNGLILVDTDSSTTDSTGYFRLRKGFLYFHLDRCGKDVNGFLTTGFLFAKANYDTFIVTIGKDTATVRLEIESLPPSDFLKRNDTIIGGDMYDFGKPGFMRRLPVIRMKVKI